MSIGMVPALRLIVLGVVLWVAGVLASHFASPGGMFSSRLALPLLSVAALLAWGTVRLTQRVAALGRTQLIEGVALVALPAALLDGIVLTWAPGLYAADPADQRAVAAWLLWFLGASFAIAALMSEKKALPA